MPHLSPMPWILSMYLMLIPPITSMRHFTKAEPSFPMAHFKPLPKNNWPW